MPVDQRVTVRFQHPEVNERHFWGQMLGGPDLALITSKVRARPRALGGTAGARGRCGVPGYPHPCPRLSAHAAPPTVGKKARESDATALAAPLDLPR